MGQRKTTGYLLQDVNLIIFLLCIGAMALTVGYAGSEALMAEFIVMMGGAFLAVLLAGFKLPGIAAALAGVEILAYTAYKVFRAYAYSVTIDPLCYTWIVIPVVSVAAMYFFVYGNRQTELENDILREQVDNLVMVNSLTGLYNLRSLYLDLEKQVAYAERNHIFICLMIVELRYEMELRKVLSQSQYEEMIQKLAAIVVDAVRVEDRVYSLDDKGTVGVMLTCDKAGSEYAEQRIRTRIENRESFKGITDSAIKVEVRIACLQYDKDEFDDNMIVYKQRVENELQYDV